MRRWTIFAWTVLTLAVPAATPAARAESLPEDEAAIQRGLALRKEQRDVEALEEFRRAYAVRPTPRAQAQIALAEQAVGHWVDAETMLNGALRTADPWIDRNRATLEQALNAIRQHLGTLEANVNVDNAELVVNGARVAPGHPTRVEAGSVILEARAAGYSPVRRVVDVPARGLARESVMLVKLEPMDAPWQRTAPPRPDESANRLEPPVTPTTAGHSTQRTWGWILVAGSSVFVAGGAIAVAVHESNAHAYNNDVRCPPGHKDDVCGANRDAANLATTFAIGSFLVAGVAAATGAALVLTAPRARVGAWARRDGTGLSFEGSF